MVITFAAAGASAVRLGEWRDLKDASAALPPGSYTTLRTYGGHKVVRLGQHAERLRTSVSPPAPPGDLSVERVRQAVATALEGTRFPESRLRLTFSPPRLFVSVEPFTPLPDDLYTAGVACATVALHRENPHAKSTGFLATAQAAASALPDGAHEGLMVAEDGSILEGLSSNFFALVGGVLRTEDDRALPGVTRSMVLEIAGALVPRRAGALRKDEIERTDEAFITSVSREILPVVAIDAVTIGDGRPGPVTTQVIARFREIVQQEARAIDHPYDGD